MNCPRLCRQYKKTLIDEDGYIFICGRKKSVIVLKNGKNIFPEEMENLVNKIEGVKERERTSSLRKRDRVFQKSR